MSDAYSDNTGKYDACSTNTYKFDDCPCSTDKSDSCTNSPDKSMPNDRADKPDAWRDSTGKSYA